jgi:uracil-DNA glycosylase
MAGQSTGTEQAVENLLAWYRDAGVDEVLVDDPLDRFEAAKVDTDTGPVARDQVSPDLVSAKSSAPITSSSARPDAATPLVSNGAAENIANAATDLAALRESLAAFDGCPLKHTAKNLVFGDGDPKADVMFIGEAPGADEDREGRPFVGVSGRLLDKMMASIGLDRDSAYITNILPWRPPGNRDPTPPEVAACLPFIKKHIQLVSPKVVVLVGGTSAKTLLGRKEGIMRLRGRWLAYKTEEMVDPIPALATFHPAFLLRSAAQKGNAWRDLLMVKSKLME